MSTLHDLAERLRKQAADQPKDASDAAVRLATIIVELLVNDTPVDSSKALSSWEVGVGNVPTGLSEPHFLGSHGSTAAESAAVALQLARAILATKQPGQVITISNAQPYIRRLNEGYSTQAPAGFVERAVAVGKATFRTK